MRNVVKALVIGVVGMAALGFFVVEGCGCQTMETAYRVATKNDLRRLATAESGVRRRTGTYVADTVALGFMPSSGVRVEITATDSGWSAVAYHTRHADGRCGIYDGKATHPVRDTIPEVPVCEGFRGRRTAFRALLGLPGEPLP